MKAKYIPNYLSVARILLVPIFAFFFFHEYPDNVLLAVILFLIAGITDVVDGFLARKFNWITNIGKILDPAADKFMQIMVLFCLTLKEFIPIPVVVVFAAKEVLTGIGALLIYKRKDIVATSNFYGKLASAVFYITMFIIMLRDYLRKTHAFDGVTLALCVVAMFTAIMAIIMYAGSYYSVIKLREKQERENNGGF